MQSITSFKLALVSTAVFGALAASPAFAADKVIKLGFSAPLTGPQAHYGEDMRNGLVLALEEAGIPVLECQYAASQPWPFPAALMIGFQAQGLPLEPSVSDELEQARWFSLDELDAAVATGEVRLSPVLSISRWLIDAWIDQARARRETATVA